MLIRPETPADITTIRQLTDVAFAPMPYADGNEGAALDQMRIDRDLTLSLVAEKDGEIIGHVAFSPAQISEAAGDWYGLGPISVRADRQKQGIGTKLAHEGLGQLKTRGAAGCVLIGRPAVYGPMGFISDGNLTHKNIDPAIVQYIILNDTAPKGEVTFAPALQETSP
ncbi:GNAT family N-acetyltransferase [Yoonia sp. 2307UL14-13]|uniref:GNAT family N-acetyltransferase n=1 Tax=Yoonia sp. 2307UL14-13 TaxID=3126506 RepID=UPI0030A3B720